MMNELDPRRAAALLEETASRARRQFDVRPPLMLLAGAPLFLIAYGGLWLSVRDQRPYDGPTGAALAVLYAIIAGWAVTNALVQRRARTGVSGRTTRQRRAEGAAFGALWVAVFTFQGALYHAGASHAVAYGVYPAAAPLIFVGLAAAADAANQENWPAVGLLIGLAAVALGGAFAGPRTAWLVSGVGLCLTLVGFAAVDLHKRRA